MKTVKRIIPVCIMFFIIAAIIAAAVRTGEAMPVFSRMVLSNGLVLIVSEDHTLPFVTMQLLVDAGSRRDPAGKEGLANLTADGLLLGTSLNSAGSFNEELDFMGADLDSSSNKDFAEVDLRVLKKDFDRGFGLFMEAVLHPAFPEKEISREIEKTRASIQSAEDDPGDVAEKAFQRRLFRNNPYGHPVEGTKESLARLTREGVVFFYNACYHPNNAVLTIVGDLTMEEIQKKIIPGISKWTGGAIPAESFGKVTVSGKDTVKIDRAITQANIILGHKGVRRSNPDYYALTVMNYILGGGGFASRLMDEVRNKRGLAYSIDSFFAPGKYEGSFQIVLETKNSSAGEAVDLLLGQMERIRREPVSEKELEGAKKYLTGSFPMRFDSQAKLARFLSQVEYFGLGQDYPEKYPGLIRSVTKDDVLRVARTYLSPDNYILVIVADLKEAQME